MSENAESVPQTPVTGTPVTTTTTGATPTGAPTAQFNQNADPRMTQVSNMAELREKSPDTYRATLEAIAIRIVSDTRRHRQRMKRALKSRK